MKKSLLIGIGAIILLVVVALAYLNYRNRSLSPPGNLAYANGDFKAEVSYSRPSVRDRLIFGPEADGALQPYGKFWRLGANESTEITINKDILFQGKELAAGTYRLYAVPGPEEFVIGVNTVLGKWGYSEPDYSKDLFTVSTPVARLDHSVEQYTIRGDDEANGGIRLIFEWSDYRFDILLLPIELTE
jgi:hypothetical protein